MRNLLSSGSKWIWILVLVLAGMLSLGLVVLPEVLKRNYSLPGTPAGLSVMSLITVGLFIGVILSLALERFERLMVVLFVAFRIGETAWEFELGRHSLVYLVVSVIAHLVIGGLVLVFLSGHIARRER